MQGHRRDRIAVLVGADLDHDRVEGDLDTRHAVALLADDHAGIGQRAAKVTIGEVGEDGVGRGLLRRRAGGAGLDHLAVVVDHADKDAGFARDRAQAGEDLGGGGTIVVVAAGGVPGSDRVIVDPQHAHRHAEAAAIDSPFTSRTPSIMARGVLGADSGGHSVMAPEGQVARLALQEGRYRLHTGVDGLGRLERVQHNRARKVDRVLAGEGHRRS